VKLEVKNPYEGCFFIGIRNSGWQLPTVLRTKRPLIHPHWCSDTEENRQSLKGKKRFSFYLGGIFRLPQFNIDLVLISNLDRPGSAKSFFDFMLRFSAEISFMKS
jgi:hypothetical protein